MKICEADLYSIFYDVPQHEGRVRSSDGHHVSVVVQKSGARHLPAVNLLFVVLGFSKNTRIPMQSSRKKKLLFFLNVPLKQLWGEALVTFYNYLFDYLLTLILYYLHIIYYIYNYLILLFYSLFYNFLLDTLTNMFGNLSHVI